MWNLAPKKHIDSNVLPEPHSELFGSFALHLGEVTLGNNQHPENKSNVFTKSPTKEIINSKKTIGTYILPYM
jgi:hypothetical protein